MNFVFFILSFFSIYLQYQANDKTNLLLNMTFANIINSNDSFIFSKDLSSYLFGSPQNLVNNSILDEKNTFLDLKIIIKDSLYFFTLSDLISSKKEEFSIDINSNGKKISEKLAEKILNFTNTNLIPFTEYWIFEPVKLYKEKDVMYMNTVGAAPFSNNRALTLNESIIQGKIRIIIAIDIIHNYLSDKKPDFSKPYNLKMTLKDIPYEKIYEDKSGFIYSKYNLNFEQIEKILISEEKITENESEKFKNLTNSDIEEINKILDNSFQKLFKEE